MYGQRYLPHLPAAGEVVIWDRSWYNRAGVERVMGFCSEEAAKKYLNVLPGFEKLMVDSGIILLKYWLEVSPEEQTRRLESRVDDGRKIWKLSPMDIKSYTRWDDYTKARDDMFAASDTAWAPWYVASSEDKKRVRLNIISHLLSCVPYKSRPREKVKLPKRKVRAQPPADIGQSAFPKSSDGSRRGFPAHLPTVGRGGYSSGTTEPPASPQSISRGRSGRVRNDRANAADRQSSTLDGVQR